MKLFPDIKILHLSILIEKKVPSMQSQYMTHHWKAQDALYSSIEYDRAWYGNSKYLRNTQVNKMSIRKDSSKWARPLEDIYMYIYLQHLVTNVTKCWLLAPPERLWCLLDSVMMSGVVLVVDSGHCMKWCEAQETPPDWTGTLQHIASWTPAMTPPLSLHTTVISISVRAKGLTNTRRPFQLHLTGQTLEQYCSILHK